MVNGRPTPCSSIYDIILKSMKIKPGTIAVIAAMTLAVLVTLIIFFTRSPVLIVSELSFVLLYGESRSRAEMSLSSLVLFRRVIPIVVADDADEDIIQFAIAESSSQPFCVLFPLRFARAARVYRENNPAIPVVVLEGRQSEGANPANFAIGRNTDDYFLYKTDIDADFYRAGLAAAILDGEKSGRIVVFVEAAVQTQARQAFTRGLNDMEKPLETSFFTTYAQFSGLPDLSCAVLAGVGADFMERYSDIPVIFFSWINPDLIPIDVAVVVNDSPLAQLVPAVRMVEAGIMNGQIQSRILIPGGRDIDKNTMKKLRKI